MLRSVFCKKLYQRGAFEIFRNLSSLALPVEDETPFEARELTPKSKRTGLIAIKAGMTQDWDVHGAFVPLTVLWIDNCQANSFQRLSLRENRFWT